MPTKILGVIVVLFFFVGATPLQGGTTEVNPQDEPIVIGFSRTLPSAVLEEDRQLTIALPEGYENSDLNYPVVYLLYGDRIPLYFAEAVSVLHTLASSGRIPQMILVGIDEKHRYRDWLPLAPDGSPTGIDKFIRFVDEELIPFLKKEFRCKDFRILVGPQAGANFALYSLFHSPDLFHGYIITHSFRWRGGRDKVLDMAHARFSTAGPFKKHLYITYRDSDTLAKEGLPYMNRFAGLVRENRPEGFVFYTDFLKGNTDFTSPTGLKKGLKTLFADYPFPKTNVVTGLKDIEAYYTGLSERLGFEIDIPEHVLAMQSDKLVQGEKVEEALEVLHYIEAKYPRSANAVWRLANIHRSRGERAEAIKYYKKCLELIPNMHPARMRLKELQKEEKN